jgi:hypothetical protein
MNEQIIIVDNFYDEPFHYHKGFDENECVITDETIGKIEQIIGNPIRIVKASNETQGISGVFAHLESDWTAVIYLSLPFESFGKTSVKLYSHISTGLESFPNEIEMKENNITGENVNEMFDFDLKNWKEYFSIPAKYNRMVLFKSDRWHSYSSNISIKYQKIIIKNNYSYFGGGII